MPMLRRLFDISQAVRMAALLALTLLVSGCKEPLYSNLDENQANEMIAILQAAHIAAGREGDGDGQYVVKVLPDDVGIAVTLLRARGYPRRTFTTLGDVFPDEGIVGTPFEERARFMYALNEELAHTISDIAGVRQARVQVIIPPSPRFGEQTALSTAAVAVYYEAGVELTPLVPTIKSLVAHSVPNLRYDDVEVALLMAGGTQMEAVPAVTPDTLVAVKPAQATMLPIQVSWRVMASIGVLLALSLTAMFVYWSGVWRAVFRK